MFIRWLIIFLGGPALIGIIAAVGYGINYFFISQEWDVQTAWGTVAGISTWGVVAFCMAMLIGDD